jgi:hypothetical protein
MKIRCKGVQVVLQLHFFLHDVIVNQKDAEVCKREVLTLFKRQVFPTMLQPAKNRMPCTRMLKTMVVGCDVAVVCPVLLWLHGYQWCRWQWKFEQQV